MDYDALRVKAHQLQVSKLDDIKMLTRKLQKAQRAAEEALDL